MGNKYTIEAGIGDKAHIRLGTEWLIIALWKLYTIEINHNQLIYWKNITIR